VVEDAGIAPNEWECLVFIAVVETGGTQAAADRLRSLRAAGSYSRQGVERALKRISSWAGEELVFRGAFDRKLYPTERGLEILEAARTIVAQYRVMRLEGPRRQVPRLACLPHHTHFVAAAENRLRTAEGDGLEVEYFGAHQRGEDDFLRRAVPLLQADTYQLVIGPSVAHGELVSEPLYHAQLEVMVHRDHPADAIALPELVTDYRMLVPPRDMRSRRLLEQSIVDDGLADPDPSRRIAGETYETAASILRLRNEARAGATNRVVVVPSDVALVYKPGMEFGGLRADRFKWVPIYRRDAHGSRQPLRMEVCVTVAQVRRAALDRVIDALRAGVEGLDHAADHGGLGGRTPQLAPAPRRRS
jgi:hypothetical protein